jgi:glycosyltransferase involved in cell wall biosynthesis
MATPDEHDIDAAASRSYPRVSILIPTHNRPEYFELALNSALKQQYPNLEIVVSDNSDDERTHDLIKPYLRNHDHLVYLRTKKTDATQNFKNALAVSSGQYISHLMDDDLFHPEKINRMMTYFLANERVGIVTSYRKVIDGNGNELPDMMGTERLFETDCVLDGKSFGRFILEKGSNLIGEPTTAIVTREDLREGFGWFNNKRYTLLSDVATWLSILATKDCVYVSDAMSYFRIHDGQDQKKHNLIRLEASLEWFHLAMDAYENRVFLENDAEFETHISLKLEGLSSYLAGLNGQITLPGEVQVAIAKTFARAESLKPKMLK